MVFYPSPPPATLTFSISNNLMKMTHLIFICISLEIIVHIVGNLGSEQVLQSVPDVAKFCTTFISIIILAGCGSFHNYIWLVFFMPGGETNFPEIKQIYPVYIGIIVPSVGNL